jgi:hypothetical protein
MNAPHDYRPALRSADLPAIDSSPNSAQFKTLKASVGVLGSGFISIQHAARGHKFAFIESGYLSRWWFKRGANSPELFADLITKSDAAGKRWRIIAVISAEIVSQG